MKKIAVIGAYPPPLGGNSVHIKRLAEILANECDSCTVYDLYNKKDIESPSPKITIKRYKNNKIIALLRCAFNLKKLAPEIAHFHVSGMKNFVFAGPILLLLLPQKTKSIITVHSGSFIQNFLNNNIITQKIFNKLLSAFDLIIAVGEEQENFIKQQLGRKAPITKHLPAYLPPERSTTEKTKGIYKEIKSNNKPVIVSSGFATELYGYHVIADAFKKSPELREKFQLLLCSYKVYDEEYMATFKDSLNNVDVIYAKDLTEEEFAEVLSFEESYIYLRATDRDGDAVAIREANFYQLKIVATDVIKRPEFCFPFDRDNTEELISTIHKADKTKFEDIEQANSNPIDAIKSIYAELST